MVLRNLRCRGRRALTVVDSRTPETRSRERKGSIFLRHINRPGAVVRRPELGKCPARFLWRRCWRRQRTAESYTTLRVSASARRCEP